MALNAGIVGLPNVGKSTLFTALTSAPAEAANYPFCTIEPNLGVVAVPDPRLDRIADIVKPAQVIPASTEFVDIAGLVEGASQGEGLGNRFLSHIREVGVVLHVVRCFADPDVVHVAGTVDPARDMATITTELCLADLETVSKRRVRMEKEARASDRETAAKANLLAPVLERLEGALSEARPARLVELSDEEAIAAAELQLITRKPVLYVCNTGEDGEEGARELVAAVREQAEAEGARCVSISAQLESEIAALETLQERKEFLAEAGLAESGLDRLIRETYHLLGLRTFFTAGPKECRAWTFRAGQTAPQCAGVIHSDFERGFIRAEAYHCEALFELGSEQAVRAAGKLRSEGRDYLVEDGDVLFFKFNV